MELSCSQHRSNQSYYNDVIDSLEFDDVSSSSQGFINGEEASSLHDSSGSHQGFYDDPLLDLNMNDQYQSQGRENDLPENPRGTNRSRTCCYSLSFLMFMMCAFAGIYAVWHLGVVGSFKSRSNESAVSSASGSEQGTELVRRTTSLPSAIPSKAPSTAPSESTVPTTFFPTGLPTETRRPSGSTLPSDSPSFQPSSFPSQPTTYPSMLPSAPTFSPTSLPSAIPSQAYVSVAALTATPTSERICNGLASNCNRRANEIMYATSHNAMSSQVNGFFAFNHLLSMEDSLVAGFRGFLLDTCDCGEDGFKFCHELCVLGTRDVAPLFSNLVAFLNENPFDVIVIELQVNDDSLLGLWELVPQEFIDLTYTHTSDSDPWPTLNQLIDMGRRVMVFQHDGPNCDDGECPEGVQGFWRYGFQTNWDLSTVADVEDYDVSCAIKTGIETRENTFMLNNHFSNNRLGLPSQGIAEIINAKEFLQNRLEACTEIVGRRTNLLAVDFWSIGDVVDVVNINNAALPEGEIVFDNIFED